MSGIHTILVPTDFSEASAAALRYACSLADAVGATICVLHTIEPPFPIGAYGEVYAVPSDYLPQLEDEASKTMDRLLTPAQREKYQAQLVLRQGAAASEILVYLAEHDEVGLVVMATHGRGGVARLMLGSVADKILRAAACPVLTIRHPEFAEAHRAA